jgi:hypothetical protein
MDNGTLAPSSSVQWAIGFRGVANGNPENGYAQFALLAAAGNPNYFYFDGTGGGVIVHDTGVPVTTDGLHFEWTLTTPSTYHTLIQSLSGQTLASFSGPLNYQDLQTNYFYIRKANGNSTAGNVDYWNNIAVVPEPAALSTLVVCAVACVARMGRRCRLRGGAG